MAAMIEAVSEGPHAGPSVGEKIPLPFSPLGFSFLTFSTWKKGPLFLIISDLFKSDRRMRPTLEEEIVRLSNRRQHQMTNS